MGEDEAFLMPLAAANSKRFPSESRVLIKGEQVRNWAIEPFYAAIFPYDETIRFSPSDAVSRFLWPWRSLLWARVTFGRQTYREACRGYEEYHQIPIERNIIRYAISFGEVATHNHFSFDRENRLFDKTAPVITLQHGATEQDHFSLLGLLNSSSACFWFKQVCFPKGGDHVGQKGARVRKTLWDERYAFNATNVGKFPISTNAPTLIAEALDRKAREQQSHLPQNRSASFPLSRDDLNAHRTAYDVLLQEMIAVQEELDWWCYHSYGICDEDLTYPGTPPEVQLGERAFEIVLARKLAAGEAETTWFQRHGSTPITEIPNRWPTDYRALVERRIALIESSSWVELVERPEYKRRWNQPNWEIREQTSLKDWLLDRLETPRYWPEPLLRSVDELTAIAERDEAFMAVGRLFTGQVGFDVQALVALLLEDAAVPALRVLRYKESGLRKRADWEQTWDLQRREDAIDARVAAELSRMADESDEDWQARLKKAQDACKQAEIGEIPVPPKYKSSDFLSTTFWRLRGPLDVTKERVFSLPNGDPAGGSLYGWAGWNAAERVRAIFGTYTEAATRKGWAVAQLLPLLAAIEEEMPWVLQWHNDIHPEFGVRLGDFFREQLGQELHKHAVTREDLANWKPAAGGRGRRRRAQT
jgi:hypothetical protein